MDLAKVVFVRGTEEHVLAQSYKDGQLYFTTDTKRIYMDVDGKEKVPMGGAGNSSIYYGIREISEDDEELDELLFTNAQIEGDTLPEVDSLILNDDDGCFYRVTQSDEDNDYVVAKRLTVAGSGGGGDSGFVTKVGISITRLSQTTFLYGQTNYMTITPNSACATAGVPVDSFLDIKWKVRAKDDSTMYTEGTISDAETGVPIQFEFGSKLFANKTNIIEFTVSGYNSGSMTAADSSTLVICVLLQLLENSDFSTLKMYEGSATIACEVYGAIEKILDFWIDGVLVETKTLSNTVTGRLTYAATNLTHGTHTINIRLYQSVNGERGSEVDPLNFEIASKTAGDNTPIIWLGEYKSIYMNYEQILIPYMAFNPTTGDTCTVRFYKNDNELNVSPATVTFSSSTSDYDYLEITDASCPENTTANKGKSIENNYYITCGNVSRPITFKVQQTGTMVLAAPDNLLVSFDASGRTNNESTLTRDTWSYTGKSGTKYTGTFSDFNWYNNGWVKDSDGHTCLRISNGAKFSIPLGATTFNSTTQGNQSLTFEFQFKVRNVLNYEKLIKLVTRYKYPDDGNGHAFDNDDAWYAEYIANQLSNYDSYDQYLAAYLPTAGMSYDNLEYVRVDSVTSTDTAFCNYYDSTKQVGFCIGTQDAFFKTNKATLNANFVEDKVVNLAFVYSQTESLVSIFLNGVLSGAVHIADNDGSFVIGDTSTKMVLSSDYCDIDLYKFRAYNTSFAISEILNNYAIDLRDTEMYDLSISLGKTNSTTKEQELDYNSMLLYNDTYPDAYLMPYWYFADVQGDALPYSKKDEKTATMTFVNPGLDRLYETGELQQKAESENYAGATIPIYWIKLADVAEEALSSTSKTANYKIQMVKLVDGSEDEYENDGNPVAFDLSKLDSSKFKRKSGDGYCTIYRTLSVVENYYLHHGASFTTTSGGAEIKTQGTSSQFYPRRNFKSKVKNVMIANKGPFESDPLPMAWFYMDNDTVGTQKFTLKIDYMESSGSYNTGAANLVANAYTKHPIDDYAGIKSQCITADLRTSVQGFPTMAFHKKSDGTYTFIGRYNMNIDKGSDECYGYKLFANNDLYEGSKATTPYVLKNGKAQAVAKIAECWEFSDNNRGYCSFRDPLDRAELSFDYPAVEGNTTDAAAGYHTNAAGSCPVVADSFEYRYNTDADTLDYLYDPTSFTDADKEALIEDTGVTEADLGDMTWRKTFLLDKMKNWEKACQWVWKTCTDNVGSEEKVFESYCNDASTDVNSYYGETTIVTYDTEGSGNAFDSASALVFDVPMSDDEVVQETTTYAVALADIASKMGITTDEVIATNSLVTTTYGVKDEENSTDSVTVKKCNADSIFQAYADMNGYEYYDYALDETGTAIGNFRKGTVKLRSTVMAVIQANPSNYSFIQNAGTFTKGDVVALDSPYTAGSNTYYFDTQEYRLAKFKNEFTQHFDKEYTLTYFVITEVLMCYDSRGKNCMMASWGPKVEGGDYIWYPVFYDLDTQLGINNTGIPSFEYYVNATEDGCFSTNDSVLWGNIYKCFLDDIKSIYQSLRTSIKRTGSSVNVAPFAKHTEYGESDAVDHIESWYKCDPDVCDSICMLGKRPLLAINLDEYYKYISIMNTRGPGYQGTDGNAKYDTDGAFLYALQGDRSLSRQQFLSRRINFIDSWLTRGNYTEGTGATIKFRTSANDPENTSDIWVDNTSTINASGQTVEGLTANAGYYTTDPPTYDAYGDPIKKWALDADFYVKLTPYQRSYVTLATDNAPLPSIEYEGSPVRMEFPTNVVTGVRKSPQYAELLLYLYGADYMKDIGDVSLLYPREFELKGATHLSRIILGNDTGYGTEGAYKNKKLKSPQFDAGAAAAKAGTGGKPLLKEVVFTNAMIDGQTLQALDFSSSEKLQIFRALGMNLSGVNFADGVALHTLHLPASITSLVLKEARNLKGLISSYTVPTKDSSGNWQAQKGLYIPGVTDVTEAEFSAGTANSTIKQLEIAGGNMGYDSFDLLKILFRIKSRTHEPLAISLTDVNWTPYSQMVKGTVYDATELANYYIDNGHYQLVPYQEYHLNPANNYYFDNSDWNLSLKNGELYYKDSTVSEETINKLDNDVLMDSNKSVDLGMFGLLRWNDWFTNTDETNNTIPRITGNIYVNNTNDVDEEWIKNTLINQWFPDLNIFVNGVKKAYSAKFVKVEDDDSLSTVETFKVSQALYTAGTTWFTNPYNITELSTDMNKQGWDFYGWSTVKDDKTHVISSEDWASNSFTEGTYEYTFYAVYEKHLYQMSYYNYDGNLIETKGVAYGVALEGGTNTDGTITGPPAAVPYKDESALDFEKCYKLKGYAKSLDGEVVDLTSILSTENLSFYAVFEEASVYDNVLDDKYFTFTACQDVLTGNSGYSISLKRDYDLTGKITLPATHQGDNDSSPKPVYAIGAHSFSWVDVVNSLYDVEYNHVTHVFWSNGEENSVTLVDNYAFAYNNKIKYCQLNPNNKVQLNQNAFAVCPAFLSGIDADDVKNFFHSIYYYSRNAFSSCTSITAIYVAAKTISIKGNAFNCPNINSIEFGEDGKDLQIDTSDCATGIFANVASAGTFTGYLGNTDVSVWNTLNTSYLSIPSGWTVSVYNASGPVVG